ncbi:MAG: AAA family ATPase, partial [Dehalococcoidia bacterium]|nr:AAA family ATPase [Dehalococcoidia bacterium]
MIILKAAHIRRFKGIDDVIIEDCHAVNAFYGRNNSGKSTILHALDMAGLALSTRNW